MTVDLHLGVHKNHCVHIAGTDPGEIIGVSRSPPQPYQGIPKTDVLV